ncbi:MAG: transporter [Fibrobacteres bacterium]|nr:transporter [Fibrobacterota bacterium]
MGKLKFLLLGTYFGIVLTKAQVISWYKIRNMFFFREPDLYLIIGSAVLVGAISVFLVKRFHPSTLAGEPLTIPGKALTRGTVIGGFIFGLGWFITGTCPGPIYAQIGSGEIWALFTLAGALAGAFAYAWVRPKIGS